MPTIEDFVFVEIALRKEQFSSLRIGEAQEMQRAMELFGEEKSLRAIILEEKLVRAEIVSQIESEMSWYWLRCRSCGKPNTLARLGDAEILICDGCGVAIEYEEGRISEEDLAFFLSSEEKEKSP